MPENLETFVKKLQSDGVDAGRKAAKKIEKQAKQQAEKIIADAQNEAEKIIEKAKNDAAKKLSRGQSELTLAVRDAQLKLRESLGSALTVLLTRRIEKKLSDSDYLGEVIRAVILSYAKADAAKQRPIEINVPKKMRDETSDRILDDLSQHLKKEKDAVGLRNTLSKAGFEYKIQGATVEVSADSVSELLLEMVSPTLQEVIDKAMGKDAEKEKPAPKKKRKTGTEPKKPEGQSENRSENRKDPEKPSE